MNIEAACSREFHAVRTSGSREIGAIRWIVLHSEEASTAESAARFFTLPTATGSAHLCVDDTTCYRTLRNTEIPWGSASCFGANQHGFHVEQAGFARWNAAGWLRHRDTLKRAAYKTALHCDLFEIPPQFVAAAQLPEHDGITTHREITFASKRLDPAHASKYDHTDPGIFWPRRYFMALVRGYWGELPNVLET